LPTTIRSLLIIPVLVIQAGSCRAAPPASGVNQDLLMGLWRAIDMQDGSEVLLSISDDDHDGILDARLTDTYFSVCVNNGFNSYPGLVDGPATARNGTLSWTYSFKCYDPAANSLVEVETGTLNYDINRRDKTLKHPDGSVYYRVNQ